MSDKAKEVVRTMLGHTPGWIPNDDPVWVSKKGCTRCMISLNQYGRPIGVKDGYRSQFYHDKLSFK